jgi:hypothetical protein
MPWMDPPSRKHHNPTRWILTLIIVILVGLIAYVLRPSRRGPIPKETAPPLDETVKISSGTIGVGGSLSDSMRLAGIAPQDAVQIERTLRPVFNPRRVRAEHVYEVVQSTDGRFEQLLLWPNPFEHYRVEYVNGKCRRPTGTFPSSRSMSALPAQFRSRCGKR